MQIFTTLVQQYALTPGDAAALASGTQWFNRDITGKTVITYSFSTASSTFADDAARFSASIVEFSAQDKAATRAVLETIAAVCNVSFEEVVDNGTQCGQVRYAYSQAPNDMGYAGFAYFPSQSPIGGDVWIGSNQSMAQWDFYRADLILHETLHAMGLKHPFEGAVRLDSQTNTIPNTVMSYSPVAGSSGGSLSAYPAEPMALDIQQLQNLYGAAAHNEGNTVYRLGDASFRTNFRALWDSAGIDTLDASSVGTGVLLDLNAGTCSDIGVTIGAYAIVNGSRVNVSYTATLSIAIGTIIEDAIGSAFDDVLVGNSLANTLDGRAGDDRFVVTSGRDFIDGGEGDDTTVFSGLRSDYSITDQAGQVIVIRLSAQGDVATLVNVERVEFADETLACFKVGPPQTPAEVFAGEAFRLYLAAFDRLPDSDGLGYHTKSLQNGVPLWEVARQFTDSPEFASRYGAPSDSDFVNLLYRNVLDRDADDGGMAFYLERLDEGVMTRADVLVAFSESPENQALLLGLGQLPLLYPV
jgi:serralysin